MGTFFAANGSRNLGLRTCIQPKSQNLGLVLRKMVQIGVETVSCERSTPKSYLRSKRLARLSKKEIMLRDIGDIYLVQIIISGSSAKTMSARSASYFSRAACFTAGSFSPEAWYFPATRLWYIVGIEADFARLSPLAPALFEMTRMSLR